MFVCTYVAATNAELSIKCLEAELCLEVAEKVINGRDVRPPNYRVPGAVCVVVYVFFPLEDYLIVPVSEYYQGQIVDSEGVEGVRGREGGRVSGIEKLEWRDILIERRKVTARCGKTRQIKNKPLTNKC